MRSALLAMLVFTFVPHGIARPTEAMAQPEYVSYQGQLTVDGIPHTDPPGEPTYFKFAIVDAGNGMALWSNDGTSVGGSEPLASVALEVQQGIFSVLLGGEQSMVPLTADLLAGSQEAMLRTWVDTGSGFETLTDQPIASSVFALQSDSAKRSLGTFVVGGELQLQSGLRFPDDTVQVTAATGGGGSDSDWVINGDDIHHLTGNVGIGTDTPSSPLHVIGTTTLGGTDNQTAFLVWGAERATGTPLQDAFRLRYDNDFFGTNEDALVIQKTDRNNNPDGGIAFTILDVDDPERTALAIRGNGRVGVGTGDPAALLHVADDNPSLILQDLDSAGAAQTGYVSLRDSGGAEQAWMGFGSTGDTDLTVRNRLGSTVLGTEGGQLTLTDTGDVGIGTYSPQAKLDVVGPSRYRNSAGALRTEITTNTVDSGFVEVYGPNGELNVSLGSTTQDRGAVWVFDENGNVRASMWSDPVDGEGHITADVKSFRVDNPRDPGTDIVYACIEGPEAAAYVRGTARLVDGAATVELPTFFTDVGVSKGMTVLVTPRSGDSQGLAVTERSVERFEVRELLGGKGTYDFDWEVKAVRRGHEDYKVIREKLRVAR
jgi:hypothetical protein